MGAKHYDTWLHKLITSTVRITHRSIFKEAATSAMGQNRQYCDLVEDIRLALKSRRLRLYEYTP